MPSAPGIGVPGVRIFTSSSVITSPSAVFLDIVLIRSITLLSVDPKSLPNFTPNFLAILLKKSITDLLADLDNFVYPNSLDDSKPTNSANLSSF